MLVTVLIVLFATVRIAEVANKNYQLRKALCTARDHRPFQRAIEIPSNPIESGVSLL